MYKNLSTLLKASAFSFIFTLLSVRCDSAILINFDAGPGNLQTGQAVLGNSPTDAWNRIDDAVTPGGDSYTALVDSNSNPLPTVTFTRTGTPYDGSGTGTTPDMNPGTTNLMEDFLWTYNGNASTNPVIWTLSGLSEYSGNSFTLVIYAAGDTGDGGASSTLALATGNGGDSASTSGSSRMISDGQGVAYVELSGTVDALGEVQFIQTSANFTAFNGAQLQIVPEPTIWAMLIGGVGVLNFWGRIRRLNK